MSSTRARRGTGVLLAVVLGLCGVALVLGYANKARCTGPAFDAQGRSTGFAAARNAEVCYSDVQQLWVGRDVDAHVVPYLHGDITADGRLVGGTVEYPVLTGVLIYLAALPADTDAGFLAATALLLAPFGLLVAAALALLSRWRALLWAATPPLVLYAVHNWELPVVACTVGAVLVVARGPGSLRTRGVVAAVLLGVGSCLKLYPGAFVLPLALLVLTGGAGPGRRRDVRGALAVLGAATATVVAVNLPFALLGPRGWWASFVFQSQRPVDGTTNSVWFWGLRPLLPGSPGLFQQVVATASPLLVLASFALALELGWRRHRRGEAYPWIGVSAAMLCGFLLLHKVHSPQYTLWLLPFLVLLRVPWRLVVAYLAADLVMGVAIFRWFAAVGAPGRTSPGADALALAGVEVGVWGRAVLLAWLFVVVLRVPTTLAGPTPGTAPGTTPHPVPERAGWTSPSRPAGAVATLVAGPTTRAVPGAPS